MFVYVLGILIWSVCAAFPLFCPFAFTRDFRFSCSEEESEVPDVTLVDRDRLCDRCCFFEPSLRVPTAGVDGRYGTAGVHGVHGCLFAFFLFTLQPNKFTEAGTSVSFFASAATPKKVNDLGALTTSSPIEHK